MSVNVDADDSGSRDDANITIVAVILNESEVDGDEESSSESPSARLLGNKDNDNDEQQHIRQHLPTAKFTNNTSGRDVYGFIVTEEELPAYEAWYSRDILLAPARSAALHEFYDARRKTTRERVLLGICAEPVPHQHRRRCWTVALHVGPQMRAFPGQYASLCARASLEVQPDLLEQIDKDVPRAFPHMARNRGTYNGQLRNVLRAYACRSQVHGYTQGQNFIAGALLIFLEEEEAFWALCTMSEMLLLDYYTTDMCGIMVDCKIFDYYVGLYFPELARHLRTAGIILTTHTVEWFMCLYTKTLPVETAFRVWDIVLRNGSAAIFEFGLRIMQLLRRKLLKTNDANRLNELIMREPRRIVDFGLLSRISIQPPLCSAVIEMRRDVFRERLAKRIDAGGNFFSPPPPPPPLENHRLS